MERVRSQKLARVRSQKLDEGRPCDPAHWHSLWRLVNRRPNRVVPTMAEIDDVLRCHQHHTGTPPHRALPSLRENGRKYYSVDREELAAFLHTHAKEKCDAKRVRA